MLIFLHIYSYYFYVFKNGKKHNDSDIRKFEDKNGEYLERWDLLL